MKKKSMLIAVLMLAEATLVITLMLSYHLASTLRAATPLEIPSGSIYNIIANLQEKGVEVGVLDLWMVRLMGTPKSGWIDLGSSTPSRLDFYQALIRGRTALVEIRYLPGQSTVMILDALAKQLQLDRQELHRLYFEHAPLPEGVLVPQSYRVAMGIDETALIRFLLDQSLEFHERLANEHLGRYEKKQWFRYISMASVIEKEAANGSEMPLVSSVIVNRLERGMRLQMDGTLNYGYYAHQRVTPQRIREDSSFYNTYRRGGLPPVPVCVVSMQAILAALYPATTDYLYFVRNAEGTHTFTHTYQEHLRQIHGR